jgi:phosphoglycolate/pyridoxal phosphate phosphatase family enzyme
LLGMSDRFVGRYDAYLLDVDGVLVRDSDPIDGAVAAFARLDEVGAVRLLTNNSARSREEHAKRLARIGFDVRAEQLLPSSYLAAEYLREAQGTASVWSIGEEGLRDELLAAGHRTADCPEEADALVVGMDRGITYDALADGLTALRNGARFIATNEDATFPVPGGVRPGAGAMVGALRGMGFAPDVVVGKPSPIAFRMALDRLGAEPQRVVVIGDRLETDIVGGRDAGLDTAFVLSGVSTRADVERLGVRPTWIAEDLAALVRGEAIGPGAKESRPNRPWFDAPPPVRSPETG